MPYPETVDSSQSAPEYQNFDAKHPYFFPNIGDGITICATSLEEAIKIADKFKHLY